MWLACFKLEMENASLYHDYTLVTLMFCIQSAGGTKNFVLQRMVRRN